MPSPALRLRLLRSVLTVLREWTLSALAQRMGTSATSASLILGGVLTSEQTASINQGIKDKIISAATRYMTKVRRLALSQGHTEPVYRDFKELEDTLQLAFDLLDVHGCGFLDKDQCARLFEELNEYRTLPKISKEAYDCIFYELDDSHDFKINKMYSMPWRI